MVHKTWLGSLPGDLARRNLAWIPANRLVTSFPDIALTPKIGHKKKRKLDSKPTYDRVFFHVLTLKRLGGSPIALPLHTNGFLKNASSKERVKPWFFVSFNIIILN